MKVFKKLIIFVLCFGLLHSLCGWAMWVTTIDDGSYVYFAYPVTGNNEAVGVFGIRVTYQTLSDLCANINLSLQTNDEFKDMEPFYSNPNIKYIAKIVEYGEPSVLVIRLFKVTVPLTATSYLLTAASADNNGMNGYTIYAIPDYQDSYGMGALYTVINNILTKCNSIETALTNSNSYLSNISTKINTISTRVTSINTSLTTIKNAVYDSTNNISIIDNTKTIATALVANGYINTNLTGILNATADIRGYLNANGTINVKLGNIEVALGDANTTLDSLYNMFEDGSYTIASSDMFLRSYNSDSNSDPYSTQLIPYDSATDIIGYINSEMVGKPVSLMARSDNSLSDRYIVNSYLDNNNYIRVLARSTPTGTPYTFYLSDSASNLIVSQPQQTYSGYNDDMLMQRLAIIQTKLVDIDNDAKAILNYFDNDVVKEVPVIVSWLQVNSDKLTTVCSWDPVWYKILFQDLYQDGQINNSDGVAIRNYLYDPTIYR